MVRTLPAIVLASGSPRRRDLLEALDLKFLVRPADLDESVLPDEEPAPHVQRLARDKAAAVAAAGELVLAADTVVVIDGQILGKPGGKAEAHQMLTRLSGRRHTVLTGVAVVDGNDARPVHGLATTEVRIASLTPAEITWYVDTGEPLDKAGAYAIQGLGAMFVEEIEGNYTNVVGLPIPLTRALFRELGFDLRDFRRVTRA